MNFQKDLLITMPSTATLLKYNVFFFRKEHICFFNVCKDIHYLILAYPCISFVICCVNFVSKVTTNYKRSLINTYKFLFQRRMCFNYHKKNVSIKYRQFLVWKIRVCRSHLFYIIQKKGFIKIWIIPIMCHLWF